MGILPFQQDNIKGGNEDKERTPKAEPQEQNPKRVTKGQSTLCFRAPLFGSPRGKKDKLCSRAAMFTSQRGKATNYVPEPPRDNFISDLTIYHFVMST
jgi:hypothetical protein